MFWGKVMFQPILANILPSNEKSNTDKPFLKQTGLPDLLKVEILPVDDLNLFS